MKHDSPLIHWGIPGMKWGVRRANRLAAAKARESDDHKTVSGLRKKKVNEMSNDELKKLTTRLQLEKQYKELTKIDLGPAQKMVAEVLLNVGKEMATTYLKKNLPSLLTNSFNTMFNIKTTPAAHQDPDNPMTPEQLKRFLDNR